MGWKNKFALGDSRDGVKGAVYPINGKKPKLWEKEGVKPYHKEYQIGGVASK